MRKILNLQILNQACPQGMTDKDCPVQQYLVQQSLFHTTINESLIEPTKQYPTAREEFVATLDEIYAKCALCQMQHKHSK